MERALPHRFGSGRRNLFAARAWPVGAQGAAKLLALLVIVAVIVTFTGDSNPAR